MPDAAGFAAALTVRDSALRAAVQAAYANGSDSSKTFDEDLSSGGIGMTTEIFLGSFAIACEGATNLLVVTLPMWGQVITTLNQVASVVEMNGVMTLTITPVFKKGLADTPQASSILLDPVSTVINARNWSATVTSPDTPPDVAALVTGDQFRSQFELKFRQGVLFGQIALPSIDGSFLGSVVPLSSSVAGVVRQGALLIGFRYVDDTHQFVGDLDALQDFAGANDVAGVVAPDAAFVMVDQVHTKLLAGVTAAGATLDGLDVSPRDGFFLVSGRVSSTGGAVNFTFHLVPSLFHTRPGLYVQYLKKPRWVYSRTWPALEFSIADVQTDVDRSWWVILFGEVIAGILTLGMADIYIEGYLSASVAEFAGKLASSKLGGPTARVQRTIGPPGGISTRVALDQFQITESGVFIGVSVRSTPTPAKLFGPTTVPATYREDVLRYIMQPPSGVARIDPALRIQWTLTDLTNNVVLQDMDGAAAGRLNFEFSPAFFTATDFGVSARLYRQLGAAVTELAALSVTMHMRSALPPNAYTRWRWQGTNPQFAVDATTNNWVYRGDLRVDRWSEWHRTDAPCRSVNAPARYRYDQQSADRLPFSLRLLENHRKGLCPYCFYGGPAGVNPNL